jgi:SAM-dependent methyltransferase
MRDDVTKINDQAYLRDEQYKDATNLNARIALHVRFSTNPYSFVRWNFDQLDLPGTSRVLEVGCGPGYFWQENRDRIPAGWQIMLTDLSEGMIAAAEQHLRPLERSFAFEVADVQNLPFDDNQFDAVIANHMLYHVPDRERAYAEFRRVLRPGGKLYAATNGTRHLRELHDLAQSLSIRSLLWRPDTAGFRLENGGEELARWFADVEMRRYPDGLIVTEAEPLVAFMLSMADTNEFNAEDRAALVAQVEQHIVEHGQIRITKDTGLFVALAGTGAG